MDAFIFARGGSKGIPGKNLVDFNGIPLLAHTINLLLEHKLIDSIFVSSDCSKILSCASSCGATPILRPSQLASDKSNELDAWRHLCVTLDYPLDRAFIVTPVTSPLRSLQDLTNAFNIWSHNKYDILLSKTPSSRNPFLNMVTPSSSGKLLPLTNSSDLRFFRRQDTPPFWDILTLLYVTTYSYISSNSSLLDGNVGWIDIPRSRSVDIDDFYDLELARYLSLNPFDV